MDLGSSTKPVSGPGLSAAARPDPTASFRAVPTQLPPQASIQQATRVEPVRFEPNSGLDRRAALDALLRATLKRDTVIDTETNQVLTRTVDEVSGEVVAQTPDEALLRLRAYLREANAVESDRVLKTA